LTCVISCHPRRGRRESLSVCASRRQMTRPAQRASSALPCSPSLRVPRLRRQRRCFPWVGQSSPSGSRRSERHARLTRSLRVHRSETQRARRRWVPRALSLRLDESVRVACAAGGRTVCVCVWGASEGSAAATVSGLHYGSPPATRTAAPTPQSADSSGSEWALKLALHGRERGRGAERRAKINVPLELGRTRNSSQVRR